MFYESPQRLAKTLAMLTDKMPEAQVVIGRELTKKFEEIFRGSIAAARDHFLPDTVKGEIVVALRL